MHLWEPNTNGMGRYFIPTSGNSSKSGSYILTRRSNLANSGIEIVRQTMQANDTAGSKPNLLQRKLPTSVPTPKAPKPTVRIVACTRLSTHTGVIVCFNCAGSMEENRLGKPKARHQRLRRVQ